MAQTAVEWLVKEFSDILGPIATKPMQDMLLFDAIQKAKQMEKEQLIEAYLQGSFDDGPNQSNAEQYYNETYGK